MASLWREMAIFETIHQSGTNQFSCQLHFPAIKSREWFWIYSYTDGFPFSYMIYIRQLSSNVTKWQSVLMVIDMSGITTLHILECTYMQMKAHICLSAVLKHIFILIHKRCDFGCIWIANRGGLTLFLQCGSKVYVSGGPDWTLLSSYTKLHKEKK